VSSEAGDKRGKLLTEVRQLSDAEAEFLMAIELNKHIEADFGVSVSQADLLAAPSLSDLASLVLEKLGVADGPALVGPTGGSEPGRDRNAICRPAD
jgi:hypothetical protein